MRANILGQYVCAIVLGLFAAMIVLLMGEVKDLTLQFVCFVVLVGSLCGGISQIQKME